MKNRFDILRQIEKLDPQADCQQIVFLVGSYEYPWLIQKSLEFALFRTYAVPSISGLLEQTGQFKRHGQGRYDDTSLIIAEITENGFDSERGRAAIQQMNRMHRRFEISNDDMLYVLSAFIFEPIRWHQRYGWRTPSRRENLANYYFWLEVGKLMGIRDIPASYEAFESFNQDYEKQNFVFMPSNQVVANATIEVFLSWYPFFVRSIARQGIYALLDEPLRLAFGLPRANVLVRGLVDLGLKMQAKIIRYLPARKEAFRFTAQKNRSYPQGYHIEQLGRHQPEKTEKQVE